MSDLFPSEIIEDSSQKHYSENSVPSSVFFGCILVAFLFVVFGVVLIEVDVTVASRGKITTVSENISLVSVVSGRIKEVNVSENDFVQKGDTVFIVEESALKREIELLNERVRRNKIIVADLELLLDGGDVLIDRLKSSFCRNDYYHFLQKKVGVDSRLEKLTGDFERAQKLFDDHVIAKIEFEKKVFDLRFERDAKRALQKDYLNHCSIHKKNFSDEISSLQKELEQKKRELDKCYVVAGASGAVIELLGVRKGALVSDGQALGVISPNGKMIAECLISPRDIGFFRIGLPVLVQIDAFNYNQWGVLPGSVLSVSDDVVDVKSGSVFFRVQCQLDQNELVLPNGVKGKLKKGMSLTGRFVVTRRKVYQLLFDKADDWLNPGNRVDSSWEKE